MSQLCPTEDPKIHLNFADLWSHDRGSLHTTRLPSSDSANPTDHKSTHRNPDAPDEPGNLDGLKKLEPGAVAAIHDQYFEKVFRYASYRLPNDTEAEDITGEVFMQLLEAVSRGKGPQTNVAGWLMKTVSNHVNAFYRKAYRRPTMVLPAGLPNGAPELVSGIEKQEQAAELLVAIRKLTAVQQHVLALRFGSGYSLTETAEVVGKKVNAVKQLQFRALAALRKQLENSSQ